MDIDIDNIIKTAKEYPETYTTLEVKLAKEVKRLTLELERLRNIRPTPYLGFEG